MSIAVPNKTICSGCMDHQQGACAYRALVDHQLTPATEHCGIGFIVPKPSVFNRHCMLSYCSCCYTECLLWIHQEETFSNLLPELYSPPQSVVSISSSLDGGSTMSEEIVCSDGVGGTAGDDGGEFGSTRRDTRSGGRCEKNALLLCLTLFWAHSGVVRRDRGCSSSERWKTYLDVGGPV